MQKEDMQTALEMLHKMRQSLMESLVEELNLHKDEEPTSFTLQDLEERFAMRMMNLNTLIATLQDMLGNQPPPGSSNTRISSKVFEINRSKLQSKLDDLLAFMSPEDLLHLSVMPTASGKYLIILANGE